MLPIYTVVFSVILFPSLEASDPETRIINGSPSTFPAQLSLTGNILPDTLFQAPLQLGVPRCGAIYFTEKCAITAGHCLNTVQENTGVTVGGPLTILGSTCTAEVTRSVQHPKYQIKTSTTGVETEYATYDVTLLKTKWSRDASSCGINKISLAGKDDTCPANSAITYGFGNLVNSDTVPAPAPIQFQSGPMDVIANDVVDDQLGNNNIVDDSMIFGKGDGTGPCYGDSGGPFVCDNKLFGVVSWAVDCSYETYPAGYARVQNPEISQFIIDTCNEFTAEED